MAKNTPNPVETPTDIPSWMDWGNLREKTGEIAGRLIALERQLMELRAEMNQRFVELRAEMSQRFSEVNQRFVELRAEINQRFASIDRKQDRLLYVMLALALGMVANLVYFIFTQPG